MERQVRKIKSFQLPEHRQGESIRPISSLNTCCINNSCLKEELNIPDETRVATQISKRQPTRKKSILKRSLTLKEPEEEIDSQIETTIFTLDASLDNSDEPKSLTSSRTGSSSTTCSSTFNDYSVQRGRRVSLGFNMDTTLNRQRRLSQQPSFNTLTEKECPYLVTESKLIGSQEAQEDNRVMSAFGPNGACGATIKYAIVFALTLIYFLLTLVYKLLSVVRERIPRIL